MEGSATDTSAAAAAAAARRRQQRRVPNEKRKRAANALVSAYRAVVGQAKADSEKRIVAPSAKRGKASVYVPSSAYVNGVV
jgi:hypothetical protein